MTSEEMITTLKLMQGQIEWDYPMDYAVAIDGAIEALKKQIPRKPIKNTGMVNPIWSADSNLCPACFKYVNVWGNKFCSYCSQAIDWTEGKDESV